MPATEPTEERGDLEEIIEGLRSDETALKVLLALAGAALLAPFSRRWAVAGLVGGPLLGDAVAVYVRRHEWRARRIWKASGLLALFLWAESAWAAVFGKGRRHRPVHRSAHLALSAAAAGVALALIAGAGIATGHSLVANPGHTVPRSHSATAPTQGGTAPKSAHQGRGGGGSGGSGTSGGGGSSGGSGGGGGGGGGNGGGGGSAAAATGRRWRRWRRRRWWRWRRWRRRRRAHARTAHGQEPHEHVPGDLLGGSSTERRAMRSPGWIPRPGSRRHTQTSQRPRSPIQRLSRAAPTTPSTPTP